MATGRKRHLAVWANDEPDTDVDVPAPALPLWAGLYAPPNPDGTRKKCVNCMMWTAPADECHIHAADVMVTADMICGYHVYGKPQEEVMPRENMQPVEAEHSGLEQVPEGTSCDTCTYYAPSAGTSSGICQAFYDPQDAESHVVVEALGCCAAWTRLDGNEAY